MMKARFLAIPVVAMALVLAGCSTSGDSGDGGDGDDLTIRIIGIGTPDFSAVDVEKWKQNLEDAGFSVDFKSVEEEDAALRAVVAGAADVYIGSLPSMITAVQNTEAPVELVAVNAQATDYVVLAQNDIESIDDLEGKTIAVNTPGSAGDTIMKLALDAEGFDIDSPDYVVIGGTSARVAALQAGQVQATVAHLVSAEAAIETGQFHALLYCGPALGPYVQTGLIASTDFTAKTEVAQKAVDALIDAERWAASDKDGYIELSQSVDTESSDALRDSAYDGFVDIDFFGVDGGLSDDLIDSWIQTSIDAGDFDAATIPDKSEWLNSTFVDDYLSRNGTFQ
ncbi:ABC transporter substrate-binding protein [Protaetiibacter mangrovi]|uniref:ABC transporter substrate-binding protein n=1 Tax=Protaetiibacter mangrovi TaxID=2970926 RepID=A0ABT1ZGT0_9MICO|nr:ABC transporter substrate-binding protein [Protaetiibacter mangrovi]MCS0499810.1 ABC transporter substrate-binding protein [Protaetiibacter mangrovi]